MTSPTPTADAPSPPAEGGCSCRGVRYRMAAPPLIVHACHCRWCQRETGSAFVLNALVESRHVEVLAGAPTTVVTPSESGKGQKIVRCPTCHVALWSHYARATDLVAFVRVGTLDAPDALAPDIHIYTSTRLPWVVLPEGVPSVPEFYTLPEVWRPASLARMAALRA